MTGNSMFNLTTSSSPGSSILISQAQEGCPFRLHVLLRVPTAFSTWCTFSYLTVFVYHIAFFCVYIVSSLKEDTASGVFTTATPVHNT